MKQTLQNIAAWVKSHPWQSALILGAVVLLGYLAYKRSGGGGGNAGGGEADGIPESPGPVQSGIPDLGSIASPITGGGLSSVPSTDTTVDAKTGDNAFTRIPSLSAPSGNLADFGSESWAPDFASSVTELIAPMGIEETAAKITGVKPSGLQSGQLAANVKANNPLANKKPSNTKRTPAQLVGKGRLFTGTFNGVTYVNGYPVTASSIPNTVIMPGGRAASNQILGIGSASVGSVGSRTPRQGR